MPGDAGHFRFRTSRQCRLLADGAGWRWRMIDMRNAFLVARYCRAMLGRVRSRNRDF